MHQGGREFDFHGVARGPGFARQLSPVAPVFTAERPHVLLPCKKIAGWTPNGALAVALHLDDKGAQRALGQGEPVERHAQFEPAHSHRAARQFERVFFAGGDFACERDGFASGLMRRCEQSSVHSLDCWPCRFERGTGEGFHLRALLVLVRRQPKPDDATRPVGVEHHFLDSAFIRFDADKLVLVAVGKPPRFVRRDRLAVVTVGLFAGEFRLRPACDHIIIGHLAKKRFQRHVGAGISCGKQGGRPNRASNSYPSILRFHSAFLRAVNLIVSGIA
jgi:hypothetical protein